MRKGPLGRPEMWARFCSLCLAMLVSLPARAASLLDCDAKDSLLVCQMRSLLTVLHLVAIILAFLLAFAILFAIHAYRSKPRETALPKEEKPDV